MKKIFKKIPKIIFLGQFLPPAPTCPDKTQSWACAETGDIERILRFGLEAFIGLIGAISILMLVWGAYQYFTAYGNEEKAQAGKKTITWSIVGLVVSLLAWAMVAWVWDILAGGVPSYISPP